MAKQAKSGAKQNAYSGYGVLVRRPHGDHSHEEWWPLKSIIDLLALPALPETARELGLLINTSKTEEAKEEWWVLPQVFEQLKKREGDLPSLLVNIPHGDHAHEGWVQLDQIFPRKA